MLGTDEEPRLAVLQSLLEKLHGEGTLAGSRRAGKEYCTLFGIATVEHSIEGGAAGRNYRRSRSATNANKSVLYWLDSGRFRRSVDFHNVGVLRGMVAEKCADVGVILEEAT